MVIENFLPIWKKYTTEVTKFVINVKSKQEVYYPGQDVTGVVILELTRDYENSDLIVKLIGKSECRFKGRTGKHGRGLDAHTAMFSNEHIIVEHQINVARPSHGRHEVDFCFNLPTGIPSSFEAPFGNIRYEVRAHIGDHSSTTAITVNDVIDCNKEEYNLEPSGESYGDVGFLCIVHGTLEIQARLNRSCYCPGEAILITINIHNKTSRNMKSLKAKLVQTIKYKTNRRTKAIENIIESLKGPKIKKGDSHVWEGQAFGIPAVVPTISNDRGMSVEYALIIQAGVSCGNDVGVKLPIVIGTVPYLESYGNNVRYGTPQDPKASPESNITTGPIPDVSIFGYPEMSAPSYSAPIGQGVVNISYEDDKYAHGETIYYPVYTFAKPREGNGQTSETTRLSTVNEDTSEGHIEVESTVTVE